MNVGDIRRQIEDLPDNMDVVVCEGKHALHICRLGTATVGVPANLDSGLVVVRGSTVFEITVSEV